VNRLSNRFASADTINTFKNRLENVWSTQEVMYNYKADLHGIGNCRIIMQLFCALYSRILVLFLGYGGP